MKKSLVTKSTLIILSLAIVMIGFFQNCSPSTPDEIQSSKDLPSIPANYLWLEEEVPSGLKSVNYFKTAKPNDMAGLAGYSFIYSEYFIQRCTVCHKPPGGWQPHFGISPIEASYETAKSKFFKTDVLIRITNNPHCPECNLNQSGEVYQAVRYWLDHRN